MSLQNNSYKGILFAAITALLWGFLPIFLKITLNYLDSQTIVWFRFTFAFWVLFFFFLFTDRQQIAILKRPPLLLIIAAIGLGVNYFGYMQGLHYTTPSNAQVIIQTAPIMLSLVGIFIFKEKVNYKQIGGFLLAGIGLYLFYRNQLQAFMNNIDDFNAGFIWIETAAVGWVIYAALQKKLLTKYHAQALNMVIYGIPAILFTPLADFSAFANVPAGYWWIVVFLGLNTLIAYGSLALAFKYTQAYKVSIVIVLNPIVTITAIAIFAYFNVTWIDAENLSFSSLIGAILLLGGAVTAIIFSRK